MVNTVIFEGELTKILFENNQVMKFYLENRNGKKIKKVKVTSFDVDTFNVIRNSIGNTVKISGEIYENNYKDKDGNWINDYTINMKRIEKKEDTFTNVNDIEIPF